MTQENKGWNLYQGKDEFTKHMNLENFSFDLAWKVSMEMVKDECEKNNSVSWEDIHEYEYFNDNHAKLNQVKYSKPTEIVGEGVIVNLFVSKSKDFFLFKGDYNSRQESVTDYIPKNIPSSPSIKPTIVFVQDEDNENPIYMKEIELLPEEKLFLYSKNLLTGKTYNSTLGCIFYFLINDHSYEPDSEDLEFYLETSQIYNSSITKETLKTITKHKKDWKLISFDELNQLTIDEIFFSAYAVKGY